MSTLATSQSISADTVHDELNFAISGFWTREAMAEWLKDLARAALPFIKAGRAFDATGDLREFVPQDRETAAAIRNSLVEAHANGLKRFAVVSSSSLVRMQYRRITEGIEVEFFDDIASARAWLRSQR